MNRDEGGMLHGIVSNSIRSKIHAKELGPHDRIPSEHQLMEEFSVSRGTVRKAIKTLVDEGLVVQEHGRGTFVSEPSVTRPAMGRPFSFATSLAERGIDYETRVLAKEVIGASADVASHLRIAQDDLVLRMRRLRVSDGKPIMVVDSWTPLSACPGIDGVAFDSESLFDAIERTSGRRIAYSSMAYSARAAGAQVAREMHVAEGSPILNLEQIMLLDDGTPVEWGGIPCSGRGIPSWGWLVRTRIPNSHSRGSVPGRGVFPVCPPNRGRKKQKSSCPCGGL